MSNDEAIKHIEAVHALCIRCMDGEAISVKEQLDHCAIALRHLRRTAHVEQGGEPVYQVRINHSCADDWTDCNKLDYERFTGLSTYSTRILYTHPAPVASVPEAQVEGCIPAHWANKAKHITSGKMSKEESGAQAVMLLKILLKAPTPSVPVRGSVGDDERYIALCKELWGSNSATCGGAIARLTSYIDARTAAPAVADGWQLVPKVATKEIRQVIRDINSDTGEGWKESDEHEYWAEILAAPPPPAAVAPEQADKLVQRLRRIANEKSSMPYFVNLVERDDLRAAANEIERLQSVAPAPDAGVRDALDKARTLLDDLYVTMSAQGYSANATAKLVEIRGYVTDALRSPAPSVALNDAEIDKIWQSLPGIEIHNAAAKTGQDTQYALRLAFARAVIARISGKGAM